MSCPKQDTADMIHRQPDDMTELANGSPNQAFYTCRRCGTLLFLQAAVIHELTSPSYTKHVKDTSTSSDTTDNTVSKVKTSWALQAAAHGHQNLMPCTSVFIEQAPQWATDVTANAGRFQCPSCKARVGSWVWSGETCSCGRWVTPAFAFQLSRVDRRLPVTTPPNELSTQLPLPTQRPQS